VGRTFRPVETTHVHLREAARQSNKQEISLGNHTFMLLDFPGRPKRQAGSESQSKWLQLKAVHTKRKEARQVYNPLHLQSQKRKSQLIQLSLGPSRCDER
jgi:hypothetical protein